MMADNAYHEDQAVDGERIKALFETEGEGPEERALLYLVSTHVVPYGWEVASLGIFPFGGNIAFSRRTTPIDIVHLATNSYDAAHDRFDGIWRGVMERVRLGSGIPMRMSDTECYKLHDQERARTSWDDRFMAFAKTLGYSRLDIGSRIPGEMHVSFAHALVPFDTLRYDCAGDVVVYVGKDGYTLDVVVKGGARP
jgi:hypothetical protein